MPVKWQHPNHVAGLSSNMKDWLLNTGSLTERLQALTNHFAVNLLGQKSLDPDKSERSILTNCDNQEWQIREVILQGKPLVQPENKNHPISKDWVFARSVLPSQLCESQFVNLGNQPLGQRIFNDNQFVRSEFQIGQLQYHPLTHQPINIQKPLWARRSKFKVEGLELIVAEAFLPDSPCYWS